MRFGHPKTQEVFESLSKGAQNIVRATVYAQKGYGYGLHISDASKVVEEGDPTLALNEVLEHIRDCVIPILLNDGVSSVCIESELPVLDIFEIVQTTHGSTLRVKHPEKPLDQIREEEAARIQYELEKAAYEEHKAREKQVISR